MQHSFHTAPQLPTLSGRTAEAALIRARRSRVAGVQQSFPPLSRRFRSYRIMSAASDPSANRADAAARRARADDGARDDGALARRRRRRQYLVAGQEGRGAAPAISTAEDISSRDCRGAAASKRQRARSAPTETRQADWRSRRPRLLRRARWSRGGISRQKARQEVRGMINSISQFAGTLLFPSDRKVFLKATSTFEYSRIVIVLGDL